MSFDPDSVRAFEQAGWQKAAGEYRTTFVQASRGFVEALLDAAGMKTGILALDLCCGPGVATVAAVQPTIEAEVTSSAGVYRRDGGYRIPLAAILGRGVKPR
jgi:hypothetical protein